MLAFSIDYYGIFFGATQFVELFCTYDTETYQQLELAVMYAECFNEAEAAVNEAPPDEPVMEEVTVSAHKRKKHAGKREEDLRGLPHAEPF